MKITYVIIYDVSQSNKPRIKVMLSCSCFMFYMMSTTHQISEFLLDFIRGKFLTKWSFPE